MEPAPRQQHPQPVPALLAYHAPAPSRRPAAVLVLAILGLVLAALGIFSDALLLITSAGTLARRDASFARLTFEVVSLFVAAGRLVLWVSLVPVCAAAVRVTPWGRRAMVRWALAFLGWVLCAAVMHWLVSIPATLADVPPRAQAPIRKRMYTAVAGGSAVAALYPLAVLVAMTRRKVRAAFEPSSSDAAPLAIEAPRAGGGAL